MARCHEDMKREARRVTFDVIEESEAALRRLEARAPRGVSTAEIVRAAIIAYEKSKPELGS